MQEAISEKDLSFEIKIYPKVIEMCAEHGYNFTGREHIIAYDTKRGV